MREAGIHRSSLYVQVSVGASTDLKPVVFRIRRQYLNERVERDSERFLSETYPIFSTSSGCEKEQMRAVASEK